MKLPLELVAVALLADGLAAEPVARIPFTMTGYHAFVEVELNDRTLSFVFDSGGGGVGLNQASARRLGLEATGSGPVTGAGGAKQVPLVTGLALGVGELRLAGVTAALVALGHLEEVVGRPVDGIIGRDVLDGRLVVLDNDRQVMEVHEERSFPFEQWGEPCALKMSGPLEVPGRIRLLSGETIAGLFHVDSGAASFLNLNSVFVNSHGLAERAGDLYPRKGRGLTGVTTTDQVGAVASVEFCGHEFPSTDAKRSNATVPVLLSGATAGVLGRSGPAGLLGNAILSRFNLVFDLEHHRMFLKPNRRWDDPIRTDASGLQLIRRPDGAILIDGVVVRSPATDAGLEPGDRILSIDGVDTAAMTLAALRDRLKEPGQEFRLQVVRDEGGPRTVMLASRALGSRAHLIRPR